MVILIPGDMLSLRAFRWTENLARIWVSQGPPTYLIRGMRKRPRVKPSNDSREGLKECMAGLGIRMGRCLFKEHIDIDPSEGNG